MLAWLDRQEELSLRLASPVIAELSANAREFYRRNGFCRYIDPLKKLLEVFSNRILDFCRNDAIVFGEVVARRNAAGSPSKASTPWPP